jgi:flavodoxin
MHQIIYFSKGGNTRKIADAMAEELGFKATDFNEATLNPETSLVFLGTGCYGGKPSPKILEFVQANDFKGKQVALFGTSGAGEGKQLHDITDALKAKGATIKGTFDCKGKFTLFNRGRPNTDDLARAKQFAKDMAKTK